MFVDSSGNVNLSNNGAPFSSACTQINGKCAGVVQSYNAAGQTGTYTGAAFTVPSGGGMYRVSEDIAAASGSGTPTTAMQLAWNDGTVTSATDTWTTTWSTGFPNWDWNGFPFFAQGGTTISFSVTVTGTVTYNVYFVLEAI